MSGVVDIILTDNRGNVETMDVLGRDSVLGMNFILIKEQWTYKAKNNNDIFPAKILKVSAASLNKLRNEHQNIDCLIN